MGGEGRSSQCSPPAFFKFVLSCCGSVMFGCACADAGERGPVLIHDRRQVEVTAIHLRFSFLFCVYPHLQLRLPSSLFLRRFPSRSNTIQRSALMVCFSPILHAASPSPRSCCRKCSTTMLLATTSSRSVSLHSGSPHRWSSLAPPSHPPPAACPRPIFVPSLPACALMMVLDSWSTLHLVSLTWTDDTARRSPQAEELGVEIYPGFSASEVLYNEVSCPCRLHLCSAMPGIGLACGQLSLFCARKLQVRCRDLTTRAVLPEWGCGRHRDP